MSVGFRARRVVVAHTDSSRSADIGRAGTRLPVLRRRLSVDDGRRHGDHVRGDAVGALRGGAVGRPQVAATATARCVVRQRYIVHRSRIGGDGIVGPSGRSRMRIRMK